MQLERTPRKRAQRKESGEASLNTIVALTVIVVFVLWFALFRGNKSVLGAYGFGGSGGFEIGGGSVVGGNTNAELRRYEETLLRAQRLTLRYRNLTGNNPAIKLNDGHTPVVDVPISQSSTESPPAVGGKKDIVIGMAQDTDPKNFAVFCSSLRGVTKADILLFVNAPIPKRHEAIAVLNHVTLVPFDSTALSEQMRKFHPSTLRWPLMFKFFQDDKIRSSYQRVWMVDVRDTFFQSDPFEMLPLETSSFFAFKGVEMITIRDCGWNGGWVKDCFGSDVLADIGDNNIICSGVSVGSMDTVFEYLTLMDDIIMSKGKSAMGKLAKFPTCERNGVDQGTHNVIVHKNLVSNIKIFDQSSGPVANLQAKMASIVGAEHAVHNKLGHKVAVVHQYDRNPELQKFLFKRYVDWVDTDNPVAEWNEEPACKSFSYKNNVDLFKARCDLKMAGGATSAASCCSKCEATPSCQAFTYYSSVCFLKSCKEFSSGYQLDAAVSGYRT